MARSAPAPSGSRHVALLLWIVLVCAPAWLARPVRAVEIVFDYRFDTNGFFDDPERREQLEGAAREISDALRDELAPVSFDALRAVIPDPSGNGMVILDEVEIPSGSIRIYVGARPLGGRLAVGGPGQVRFPCFDLFPQQRCFDAMRGRGDLSPFEALFFAQLFRSSPGARAYPPDDFAPWGGFLSFATDVAWYAGRSDRVPRDRFDLLSVAVHELGHVLGVGTAESWAARASGGSFHGGEVVSRYGAPAPLAADLSHWRTGTLDRDGAPAAFQRGLAPGERRLLTELDRAALRDVGWRRAPPGTAPRFEEAYASQRIKGDVDGDGRVDARDAAIVWADVENGARAAGAERDQADVFPIGAEGTPGDGRIDADDLRMLEAAVHLAELAQLGGGVQLFLSIENELALAGLPDDAEAVRGLARLLGWDERPFEPELALPLRGDLDGDLVLTGSDAELLEALLAADQLADERAFEAADVAPFLDGEARGDGVVDEADAALLAEAVASEDLDGDGVVTELENLLNELVWMPIIGRPRYQPLTRWTESCLDPELLGPFGRTVAETGGPSLEFCSRDGTPWSLAPSLSPEEMAAALGAPPRAAADAGDRTATEEPDPPREDSSGTGGGAALLPRALATGTGEPGDPPEAATPAPESGPLPPKRRIPGEEVAPPARGAASGGVGAALPLRRTGEQEVASTPRGSRALRPPPSPPAPLPVAVPAPRAPELPRVATTASLDRLMRTLVDLLSRLWSWLWGWLPW